MVACTQQRVLACQADLLAHAGRGGGQMVHVNGLREEVLGTELHGAHGGLAVARSREENDRSAPRLELLEHAQSRDIGKVGVEDHDVGTHAIERLEAGLAGARPRDLVPDPVEVVTEHA